MQRYNYASVRPQMRRRKRRWPTYVFVAIVLFTAGYFVYKKLNPVTIEEAIVNQLEFDASFSEAEKQAVSESIKSQAKSIGGHINAHVETVFAPTNAPSVVEAYVPVTSVYSANQQITKEELAKASVNIWHEVDPLVRAEIAKSLGASESLVKTVESLDKLDADEVVIVPAGLLDFNVKLLTFEGSYYLDNFQSGAIIREVSFSGGSSADFKDLILNNLPTKDTLLTVKQTGVTALTREMMTKLTSVKDPLHFSKNIGPFLADADITHASNEVSFKENCAYSRTSFCSDPRFIETLKDSGVDLVELTGNHNNDTGNKYNTETINLYHSLGMATFGGGLNAVEAAKFYVADKKQSKVAFLGYNFADSPNSGAIATSTTAGGNRYDPAQVKADIESAKTQSDFVIVDVQYWECYAYPNGYVEYPICDKPIGEQEATFKAIIDMGADMVVGTQAHQPQTYEIYKGKPIYYGLGNLYFDQTQWPGTERGIILTHYFSNGKLVQTKLSPTVYGAALQTALMENDDAVSLLSRLQSAR